MFWWRPPMGEIPGISLRHAHLTTKTSGFAMCKSLAFSSRRAQRRFRSHTSPIASLNQSCASHLLRISTTAPLAAVYTSGFTRPMGRRRRFFHYPYILHAAHHKFLHCSVKSVLHLKAKRFFDGRNLLLQKKIQTNTCLYQKYKIGESRRTTVAFHFLLNHEDFKSSNAQIKDQTDSFISRALRNRTCRRYLIDTPGCKIPKYDPFTIGVIPFTENLTRKHKFVKIRCTSSHAEFYSGFHLIPQLKRSQYYASSDRMNVLILGMDSVSRLNMNRRLPHSSKFVRESLEAFELVAYNKIGENTFPNLMALLSGLSEEEVASMTKNRTFDHVPFLWTTFKRKGYQTVFMEEMPEWPLFIHPAKKGFRRQVVIQRSIWQYGSSDSEHTDRRSRGQPTLLLSIFVESLRVNRNRLTTPYDVHATIRSLTSLPDFDPRPTARGLNLFRQVPSWRTCEEALIPFQFCACERAEERITDNSTARPYALLSLAFINTEAQRHFPGMCATWTLDAVLDATIMRGVASKARWFRVVFTTQPKGQFQVFGTLHLKVGSKKKPVEFVERMDWYSNRTRCLPPSVAQKLEMMNYVLLELTSIHLSNAIRQFMPLRLSKVFLKLKRNKVLGPLFY
ncbi:hypothetical protein HPB47_020348 [Ixodes persulcatus]|uniref:Uncharacterized protein n=1 Tax=Ixodes persulcatus TaxID=34615 RepID=A0AC60QFL8_IXOPE|nr:hypothetical protein HPB47_020348 [Ixodes persulcatus]